MQCKPPDMQFFRELKDVNREFLRLIAAHPGGRAAAVLGMDAGHVECLKRLDHEQLDFIARAPGMLATVEFEPRMSAVAEASAVQPALHAGWAESARLFAAGLSTYLWQMARRDPAGAAFCIGRHSRWLRRVAELGFEEIQRAAGSMSLSLRARFAGHPRFWPDLIRAAASRDAEFRSLSRLSIIPLTLAENRVYAVAQRRQGE